MNTNIRNQLAKRKRRIERQLDKSKLESVDRPVLSAANIHYEIADLLRGMAYGGIARHISTAAAYWPSL